MLRKEIVIIEKSVTAARFQRGLESKLKHEKGDINFKKFYKTNGNWGIIEKKAEIARVDRISK